MSAREDFDMKNVDVSALFISRALQSISSLQQNFTDFNKARNRLTGQVASRFRAIDNMYHTHRIYFDLSPTVSSL